MFHGYTLKILKIKSSVLGYSLSRKQQNCLILDDDDTIHKMFNRFSLFSLETCSDRYLYCICLSFDGCNYELFEC
jgi:hypothetical protein